jgi:uncharacterized OB-fold protein
MPEPEIEPMAGVVATLGVPPLVTPENQAFFQAAARHELVVEHCCNCGLHVFPPRGVCRRCYRRTLEWVQVKAPGVLYSYTVNYNAWSPTSPPRYVMGLVEFPQCSSIRFMGFLEDFDDEPEIGALVDIAFHTALDGQQRVHFTPWRGER